MRVLGLRRVNNTADPRRCAGFLARIRENTVGKRFVSEGHAGAKENRRSVEPEIRIHRGG